jgi:lysophospholipase L1-like esterase
MQSTADYIIFEGGINDYWLGVPVGTITPDYVSALDDTTFCGAFESMLKQAILKWKGKKIGFIIAHKIKDTFYPYGSPTQNQSEVYWDKAREICKKWSVPYLDLFNESGLNAEIDEINNMYFQIVAETGKGDGCHPNEQGYRQFLAPKIEAWMKTL